MKVLIIGANGQIGQHLAMYMKDHPTLEPIAMIRDEAQATFFEKLNVQTVVADLEDDIDAIAKAATGCDAMVFTAGSGPHTGKEKTILVDLDGAVKSIEAAKLANIDRYIMISSFDTSRNAIQEASNSFAPYVVAKHYADEWLRAANLKHTIIHPGVLTNDDSTGKVTAATTVARDEVPRADIAKVILASLENEISINKEFQVVRGDTSVATAIQQL